MNSNSVVFTGVDTAERRADKEEHEYRLPPQRRTLHGETLYGLRGEGAAHNQDDQVCSHVFVHCASGLTQCRTLYSHAGPSRAQQCVEQQRR